MAVGFCVLSPVMLAVFREVASPAPGSALYVRVGLYEIEGAEEGSDEFARCCGRCDIDLQRCCFHRVGSISTAAQSHISQTARS